jgi:hypothetical protein
MSSNVSQGEPVPSQAPSGQWIYAHRQTGDYPEPTQFSGKWLIFAHVSRIDALWCKVKDSIERGYLGNAAKVSTPRGARASIPRANREGLSGASEQPRVRYDEPFHVICVYTYDSTDIIDVMGIRGRLRDLGVRSEIRYKADADTRQGRYGADYQPVYRS